MNVYAPATVFFAALSVNCEVAAPPAGTIKIPEAAGTMFDCGFGTNPPSTPLGRLVAVSITCPLKPLIDWTETVIEVWPPCGRLTTLDVVTAKSGIPVLVTMKLLEGVTVTVEVRNVNVVELELVGL